jgi:nucleotide-binding universal stress UspA family protein
MGGEVAADAEALGEHGRGVLERGRASGAVAGLDVEVRDIERAPAHGLLAVADEVDARMIVTGSYGEPPLKGVIIGSTPYRLMHLSERPVLVVRAAQAEA